MNAEMKEAEKHLTGMEKWCGLCICPWNRRPKVRDVDGTWQSNNKVSRKLLMQYVQLIHYPSFYHNFNVVFWFSNCSQMVPQRINQPEKVEVGMYLMAEQLEAISNTLDALIMMRERTKWKKICKQLEEF